MVGIGLSVLVAWKVGPMVIERCCKKKTTNPPTAPSQDPDPQIEAESQRLIVDYRKLNEKIDQQMDQMNRKLDKQHEQKVTTGTTPKEYRYENRYEPPPMATIAHAFGASKFPGGN